MTAAVPGMHCVIMEERADSYGEGKVHMLMVQAEDTRTALDEIRNDARFYHQETIEQVIRIMRTQLHKPLSLEEMAEIACLSPYYFNRIFHQVIGIPPGEFLATLRLDAARHLLLTTSLSVTDICFEVGYSGLGSFTTRFTQLVGVPPRQLRQLVRQEPLSSANVRNIAPLPLALHGLSGHIHIFRPFKGTIFIGLFPKPIPQARPVSCTRIHAPGPYHLAPVPDGIYYLMVAAFPPSEDPHTYLLAHDVLVGVQGPLHMRQGKANGPVDVILRAPRLTDPPILSALPFL